MNMTVATRLPVTGLFALAMAGFLTILTEALPAGLLPQMSLGLSVSESLIGQLVTVYALGSLGAAIPITTATQTWNRRPLLLAAVVGFAVANTITAVSTSYAIILIARVCAGISAGLLWALLAGYASRMAPAGMRGRAIAIAMAGTPVALSIGVPAGTFLGNAVGWRYTFAIMSLLSILLILWIILSVPDFPGQSRGKRIGLLQAISIPGLKSVLAVTLLFVLAHNVLYTYIVPFLQISGLGRKVDVILLVFGFTSLAGIWVTGAFIDRYLRPLVLCSAGLFLIVATCFSLGSKEPFIIYIGTAAWGCAFGGAATLFQTASANAAGEAADVAQSMLVTVWNAAIAGGGIIGGILLETFGANSFAWAIIILLVLTLFFAASAKHHGFPADVPSH